jgi:serine/threonine protein phosphatase PrpC
MRKGEKYLVLATDGMWDELEDQEVNQISNENKGRLTEGLFKLCIQRMEERNNTTF